MRISTAPAAARRRVDRPAGSAGTGSDPDPRERGVPPARSCRSRPAGRPPRRSRTGRVRSGRQLGGGDAQRRAALADLGADGGDQPDHRGLVEIRPEDPAGQRPPRWSGWPPAVPSRPRSRRLGGSRRPGRPAAGPRGGRRHSAAAGSTPRSKRRDASEDSWCRREVLAMVMASKQAASITTEVVPSENSVDAPPITPASPIGPESSVINRSDGSQSRTTSSSVRELLARVRLPYDDRAGEPLRVVGVQGLTGLQHHVVGDVHGQRDRPHPGELHPARQPARAGPGGVDAGHRDGDEQRAGRRTPARPGSRRRLAGGTGRSTGSVKATSEGLGRLPGQSADGQAVAPVGGHGDVEHVVAQVQSRHASTPGARPASVSTKIPAWSSPEPELLGRADHPVRDVAVGLARGDREVAGQHGPRQRDDDEVVDGEVVGAADDARGRRAPRCRPGTSGWSCRWSAARRRRTAPGRRPPDR